MVGLRGVSQGGFSAARTTPALTDSELINSDGGGYDLGYGAAVATLFNYKEGELARTVRASRPGRL